MKERDLYRPLIEGANAEGWLLYRYSDGAPGKAPWDIAGCDREGRSVGLEVKVIRTVWNPLDPFPWGLFEPQQTGWLVALSRKPLAWSLAVLYHEETRRPYLYRVWEGIPLLLGVLSREEGVFHGWPKKVEKGG